MDIGTALSVVQTLFNALQCPELRELFSIFDYKSELENLQRTVNTIKAVFKDAEFREVKADLSKQAQLYIDDLKDAVYDAEDLLDEFVTLAEQKKLIKDGNVSKKFNLLFSRFKSLPLAHKTSREVKKIRKRLHAIASDHKQFGFELDIEPTRRRREDTCSYVYVQDIIGREDDVEKIVHRLLDPDVKHDVSCLAIVGMGGLGKTALAQLVYNDPRIKENFPLRLWTCVADQDKKTLDLKAVFRKILDLFKKENREHLAMEPLQKELQEKLVGKKYFLVLDDVWNEVRDQWLKLMGFLKGGLRGSWILVTTRSGITGTITGGEMHELKGLSDEDSWLLFERTSFVQNAHDLVEIGQEIVKKCAGVPLAIRVVGSLLYGHPKQKWLLFQKKRLGKLKDGENEGIGPILKFSYHHLESPLKTCFSYCALFPKDYVIEKEKLINLWMAQGYVVPLEEGQSIEDAGDEYFSILLRRCFFQDVHKDKHDEIIYFKMHDLMHDLAQEVAGKEIPESNCIPSNLKTKIRHLMHQGRGQGTKGLFTGTKIRTYLRVGHSEPESPEAFGTLLANWISLRALDLRYSGMTNLPSTLGKLVHLRYLDLSGNYELEVLPDSIGELHNLQTLHLRWCNKLKELPSTLGKLLHLRYLDLSNNDALEVLPDSIGELHNLQTLHLSWCRKLRELPSTLGKLLHLRHLDLTNNDELEVLPDSIGELHNLQTLHLRECRKLKELPKDLGKLTSLRVLDIGYCESLTHFPRGVGKLSCLWKLPFFIVGEKTSSTEELQLADQVEEIKALHNLKGYLLIQMYIPTNAKYAMESGRKGKCLSQHLTEIVITFYDREQLEDVETRVYDIEEALLEDLQPHPNLRGLELEWYCGGRMPTWAREENLTSFLPNLVSITLSSCYKLQHLSGLGKLSKLKSLKLIHLYELEYMENTPMSRNSSGVGALESEELFFPSLEKLQLSNLSKLKGWWRDDSNTLLPSFPRLSELEIWTCPNLASMPLCPSVEELTLVNYNVNLRIMESIESGNSKLRSVWTNKVGHLKLVLPMEGFQCLKIMYIINDKEVESLSKVEDVFRTCSSSLAKFQILHCSKLKSVSGGLEHLTALESLKLYKLPSLSLSKEGEGEEEDGMPWRCLQHSLRSLRLYSVRKMVKLPDGMRNLTALQSLIIKNCKELETVPEWMPELTSLKKLRIYSCSDGLKERCRKDTGEDWPKIQHIPDFHI